MENKRSLKQRVNAACKRGIISPLQHGEPDIVRAARARCSDVKAILRAEIIELSDPREPCLMITAHIRKTADERAYTRDDGVNPVYRLFQTRDVYITERATLGDDGETERKWYAGTTERYSFLLRSAFATDEDVQRCQEAMPFLGIPPDGGFNATIFRKAIIRRQYELLDARLTKRKKKEHAAIDAQMARVPALPADFEKYALKKPFAGATYLFYRQLPEDTGKQRTAYCSHCRKTSKVQAPRHNDPCVCPACRTPANYKAAGRQNRLLDEEDICLVQRTKGTELVLRHFWIQRRCIKTDAWPEISLDTWENLRTFYPTFPCDPQGIRRFQHRNDIYFGKVRWLLRTEGNGSMYAKPPSSYRPYLYPGTLNIMALRRFRFAELLRRQEDGRLDTEECLASMCYEPVLEFLHKAGIFCLCGYKKKQYAQLFDKEKLGSVQGVLKMSDHYVRIAHTLTDANLVPVMQELSCANLNLPLALIERMYEQMFQRHEYFNIKDIYARTRIYARAHPERLLNYIEKLAVTEKHHIPFRDYADYYEAAEENGRDMSDPHVLFPKGFRSAKEAEDAERRTKQKERDIAGANIVIEQYRRLYNAVCAQKPQPKCGLAVLVPESAEDIIREGATLRHCVGNYVGSVKKGKAMILFVRKKDALHVPFYTMEIQEQRVVQCRGFANDIVNGKHVAKPAEVKEIEAWVNLMLQNNPELAVGITA